MCLFLDKMLTTLDWINHIWFVEPFSPLWWCKQKIIPVLGKQKTWLCEQMTTPQSTSHRLVHIEYSDVIGSLFFESVNVDQANYIATVQKCLVTLQRKGVDIENEWFQLDGAIPTLQIKAFKCWDVPFKTESSHDRGTIPGRSTALIWTLLIISLGVIQRINSS